MYALRVSILLALGIILSTCSQGFKQAKQGFLRDLTNLVHDAETKSIQFQADLEWNVYDIQFKDLTQLEYPKYSADLSPVERQQILALKERYKSAKTRYIARRIEERVNNWSTTIRQFLSEP